MSSGAKSTERKALWSWATYDFANSAYTTLIVTFIYSAFFTQGIASDPDTGTVQWANAVTVSAILIALLSPVMGAIADQGGHRKVFLLISTATTVVFTSLLYLPVEGQIVLALTIFVISNIAFEMCNVFYNSYLPDLADRENIGRISGYGWALGYFGGLLAMVIALVGFIQPDEPWFGFSRDGGQNVRATTLLVALWFGLFSIPMFLWVKDPPRPTRPTGEVVSGALRQLGETFHEIRKFRQVVKLLIARMFYNDGLVTIFAFGSIYAMGTFGFSLTEVTFWALGLNVTAIIGAFGMGFLDDKIGGRKTILITIVGMVAITIWGAAAQSRASLWAIGLMIGLFVGPNQSASRSLLGRFVPESKETEFFGFFAFSGKAIAFMGPWLLGRMVDLTGSQRWGMASVIIFFAIGGLILLTVDEEEGVRVAHETV